MTASHRAHRRATLTTAALAFVATCVTAAPAAAQAPEAYIGTFVPHGLEGRDYVDRHLSRIQNASITVPVTFRLRSCGTAVARR